ncbi:hypothetical protein D3C73_1583400 [compost metagenome]
MDGNIEEGVPQLHLLMVVDIEEIPEDIIEPVIGVHLYPPLYLRRIKSLRRQLHIGRENLGSSKGKVLPFKP